jgi:hypothetical protein
MLCRYEEGRQLITKATEHGGSNMLHNIRSKKRRSAHLMEVAVLSTKMAKVRRQSENSAFVECSWAIDEKRDRASARGFEILAFAPMVAQLVKHQATL